jgi:eukaryotic-like serine/threonine-protein kinase
MHFAAYLVAFLENDAKEMQAQAPALSGKPGEETMLGIQASSELYYGRLTKARELSRRAVGLARRSNLNEVAAQIESAGALYQAELGNSETARQSATDALDLFRGIRAKQTPCLALARAGDVNRSESCANELSKRFPSDTLLQRRWLPTMRASIELARKNPAGALASLQTVSYELGGNPGFPSMYPFYIRGGAYLATHKGQEAAAEFQKILDRPSAVLNSPIGALAHLQTARAYAMQGDMAKARTAYQDFLALWKDADPDIPILKEAKAEYAKLQR